MSIFDPLSPELGRIVIDSAAALIVILKSDGIIVYVNRFAEQLTGFTVEELIGKSYFEVFLPPAIGLSIVDGAHREWERIFGGGEPSRGYENPLMTKAGELRWMAWNAQLVTDDTIGQLVVAIGQDITSRCQAQAALGEREAQLNAILDAAVDCIITIDQRGIIRSVNAAAERTFGYPAEELIGQNVSCLMPEPYRSEHDGYLANFLRTGERKIIGIGREVVGLRRDGSTFPADVAVSEAQAGGRLLFTGIVRDISDRRRAEERMLQAERLAAIGQMITGLAHESRNAFQRSQACLEMLELEVDDRPEAMDLVRRIQRAQDQLHQLYEEVRDYAAPIKLKREPCSLVHVWRDTWTHLELARSEKKIRLSEQIEVADPTCLVDVNAVEQLFRNILENAIAACPDPGEIRIRCSDQHLGSKPAVCVSIRDNGPGFDAESLAKVFEPFFTTKTKGTGLGMAIAHRIVEAHGGSIRVGDGPHPGGEILVTLPRL